MKKLTVACGLVVALAACSNEPMPPMPETHSLAPKIVLDVQSINLADRSGAQPMSSPYNNNHFSPTIAESIKQWASDRMQASGQAGRAIVIIKDASLSSQPLPMESGMDSWFTRQQAVKYVARADVSVEANGTEGFAITDATASRSVTLPEDATATEKQDAYYHLLDGLMKDLGHNLESGIQDHMNKFVITAPIYGTTAVPMTAAMPMTAPAAIAAPVALAPDAPVAATVPAMSAPVLPGNAPVATPVVLTSAPTAPAVPVAVATTVAVPAPAPMAAMPAMAPAPAPVPDPVPVYGSGKVSIPLSGPAAGQ